MRAAVAILAVTGCAYPELSDRDARIVALVGQAWDEHGMPEASGCEPLEARRHNSLSGYVTACSKGFPAFYRGVAARSAGCTRSGMYGARSGSKVTIHIAPGYNDDDGLIGHEVLHYLTDCSGSAGDLDRFDAAHANKTVWSEIELEVRSVLSDDGKKESE